MKIYFAIMSSAAVLFFIIAIKIYRGNLELIHDYHMTKINDSDRHKYGKAFSIALIKSFACGILSG